MDFLCKFITQREIPVLFALANGIVLLDKFSVSEQLVAEARKILEDDPPVNTKWENERYKTKRRSEMIEIYSDLLDVNDEISFNYIITLLIDSAMPLLVENNQLWPTIRKKTMTLLKLQCYDGYHFIETLLSPACSLPDKCGAAKGQIECVLKPHGGILTGDAIIFRLDKIW